jgi:MFS family permease
MGLFSLLYNLYLLRLGFREDFIGLLAGMAPLSSGLLAIPIGMASDRWGRKPFLVISSLLMALPQVGLCFLTHEAPLLFLGLLSGFSLGMIFVNNVPFLSENTRPEERGVVISLSSSLFLFSRMATNLVGGNLPGWVSGWLGAGLDQPEPFRYTLLLGAGLTALSIVPALAIRETKRPQPPDPPVEGIPSRAPVLVPWGVLLIFAGISTLRGLGAGLSFPFFNVFFEERIGATPAEIGTLFFCAQAISVPSTVASPSFTRRFGAVPALFSLRMAVAISLAALGFTGRFWTGFLFFMLYTIADSSANPQDMTFATTHVPRAYWGRAQSYRVMGFQVSFAAGSMLAGRMILRYGYTPTFGLGSLMVLGSAILLIARFGWRYREE